MKAYWLIRCASLRALCIALSIIQGDVWAADEQAADLETEPLVSTEPLTEAEAEIVDNLTFVEKSDWAIAIGIASFSLPQYPGDNNSKPITFPNVELRYKDRFNLSFLTGLNYDFLNRGRWSAGPEIEYGFGRDTNSELIGFEEVNGGLELGGFVEYIQGDVKGKVEVLQGIESHNGTFLRATLRHAKLYDTGLIPLFFLIGPALRFGDSEYLNTFFGVDEQQSSTSGLPQTSLSSGLISYGLDMVLVVPLSRKAFIRNFFLFEMLADEVADSPVVTAEGDAFQRRFGIELGYLF